MNANATRPENDWVVQSVCHSRIRDIQITFN